MVARHCVISGDHNNQMDVDSAWFDVCIAASLRAASALKHDLKHNGSDFDHAVHCCS